MKKVLILAAMMIPGIAMAQLDKLKAKVEKTGDKKETAEAGLPKGFEEYATVESDPSGISGVYYAKHPLDLAYLNAMNFPKSFQMDKVTIKKYADSHGGRLNFVKDEVTKKVRSGGTDLEKVYDFGTGPNATLAEVAKKFNFYAFEARCISFTGGTNKKSALADVFIFRCESDPDILLVGQIRDGKLDTYPSNNYSTGGYFNVLSKDKAKLANWDSVKIVNALIEHSKKSAELTSKAYGDLVELPKQKVNDDTREKECAALIKAAAAQDKPKAWGDKFQYCYVSKDWKVELDNSGAKSHRWCEMIATSTGWDGGSDGRYIPVIIKQKWTGTDFGPSYFGGFVGALVPISASKIVSFSR